MNTEKVFNCIEELSESRRRILELQKKMDCLILRLEENRRFTFSSNSFFVETNGSDGLDCTREVADAICKSIKRKILKLQNQIKETHKEMDLK